MTLTVAGRTWEPREIEALIVMWHDPRFTIQQIADAYGITYAHLMSMKNRRLLGLGEEKRNRWLYNGCNGVIVAGGRAWTPEQIEGARKLCLDTTLTTKEIARRLGVHQRLLSRPRIIGLLGLPKIERRPHGGNNWRGNLDTKTRRHPLIRKIYLLLNQRRMLVKHACEQAGVSERFLYNARHEIPDFLGRLDAILRVLGHRLDIVPAGRQAEKDAA